MQTFKLIELDNKASAGQGVVGQISTIDYDGTYLYFIMMRTSRVESIVIDGDVTTVQTKNSKYTFKKETK